ncbi:MAG: DedA family protein [Gemmatales bacterium]|nr:DedA family protein [Gemmatales bacterium]MDW8387500.1 DedA family protein [Gemmatales bacterium]
MESLAQLLDVFLHLHKHINDLAGAFGPWTYVLLFVVVFCETGLIVTPFLPGDSLLFAVGVLAGTDGSPLSLPLLAVVLIAAAILGDAVNYWIGYRVGPKVFCRDDSWLFNKAHLLRAQRFYEKYGGKTIVLARFIPIIRTFAPFVAGIGKMNYGRFAFFNVSGGIAWVLIFLMGGYFLGQVPAVEHNFHIIIFAIIVVSLLPALWEYLLSRRERTEAKAVSGTDVSVAAPPPGAGRTGTDLREHPAIRTP